MKQKKDKQYIVLGNAGKIYINNKLDYKGLGTVKCHECQQDKPFESMRWSELHRANLCAECREKNGIVSK